MTTLPLTQYSLGTGSNQELGPFQLDTVHMMDCIEAMEMLPDDCVDLAIADPPYNASKGGVWKWDNSVRLPGFGGDWSKVMAEWDDKSLVEYFEFTLGWLSQLKRVVRPTGSIWVHGTFHNAGIMNFAMQLLSIEIINEIAWYKRNSFPNLSGRRLTASHETILWAHTGRTREYFFDYQAAKEMACPEDRLKEPRKQMRTVWDIPNNKSRDELRYGKHPTQKPLRLLKRMLGISVRAGQTLLVPFAGAGSECVAAQQLGVRFLGFETDPQYVTICRERTGNSVDSERVSAAKACSTGQEIVTQRSTTAGRSRSIPSLVKWTGSKRSQAHAIASHVPDHKSYIEPFLGGGALLYLTAKPGAIAGDIYEPLIGLWRQVQKDPGLVNRDYAKRWDALQRDLPNYYYAVRDRFNQDRDPADLNFLLRTCVNGIVRFNHEGQFNNSFHLSRKGMHPSRFQKAVRAWHDAIAGVRFVCQDYRETLNEAEKGDFVYLDPPYAGSNARYAGEVDLVGLFENLEELNQRGVSWALSFDGQRGSTDLSHDVPDGLYRRKLLIPSGNSPVGKVLNGAVEPVYESLYLSR